MQQSIKYKEMKIGKYQSDNLIYTAVVIHVSQNVKTVTVWKHEDKIIQENMNKVDWEEIRDSFDLVMYDVQTMEWPLL